MEERWRVIRIKDRNVRLELGEDGVRRISQDYFEDLYSIDTQEQIAVHVCGFYGVKSTNYFRAEQTGRTEVE